MIIIVIKWLTVITTFMLCLIKLYQKLSCGICHSSSHLVGKVIIVTDGNGGLGLETARDLADRGAKLILATRNETRGKRARDMIIELTGNKDVHYRYLDLASFKSIKQFVEEFKKTEKRLDVLINNAAVGGVGYRKTEDGLNWGMQFNYYGPFLLTCLLVPLLKSSAPSRIINVSSVVHYFGEIDFNNLNMERYWSDYLVYANSKLFLNLMTLELSRKLSGNGVTVNCLNPGISASNIVHEIPYKFVRYLLQYVYKILFKNAWEVIQTTVYLVVSPEVRDVSGKYFSDCRQVNPSKKSQDANLAKKLWIESEELVKYKLEI